MIKLLLNNEEVKFTTTIFPDGTSQVWKIEGLTNESKNAIVKIQWVFENEAELFHVCQLANLIQAEICDGCILEVPYLPYGRQDKTVSNGLSFALNTFKTVLLASGINHISTFDAHSMTDFVGSIPATEFHRTIFNHSVVCFPDKGAATRYSQSGAFGNAPVIYCEKVRNQSTGEITGLKIIGANKTLLEDQSVLIVDDICDGGMTFIKVTEALKQFNPKQVDLAVSHGLFSKGKQCLHDAGITNVFTTNSLLKNPEGFKVW